MRKPTEKFPEPALTFPAPAWLTNNIVVILVEPAVPGNVGSTARAIKTMGLSRLVVVNGCAFKGTDQAKMMGHGAWDILDNAREATTWEEAVEGVHWVIGTTHRKRRSQFSQPMPAREAAVKLATLGQTHPVALVFGREESGLSDVELRRCNEISSVPSGAAHPSLNLSQAVMLYVYEIFQASLTSLPPPRHELASNKELELALTHLGESLGRIGFRPHQGDPESFLRSLRRLFSRAPLEKRDCNVLHRICQQIDYYVERHPKKS
jgi:TrmH family RNA methyltransferase